MVDGITIPNETWGRQAIYGYQTVPTTGVTPTRRFRGDWSSLSKPTNTTRAEATGKRARRVTPRQGPDQYSGTYAEDVAFQDFVAFLRAGLKSGGTGSLRSSSSGVYDYAKSPNLAALDLDLLTVDHYVEGLGFRDTGVFFNEWNLAIDADDTDGVWKVSGTPMARSQIDLPGFFDGVATGGTTTTVIMTSAGYVSSEHVGKWVNIGVNHTGYLRQITANDTTTLTFAPALPSAVTASTAFRIEPNFTTGISFPSVDLVPSYGTKVFLDEDAGDIGTTQIVGRMISTNVTVNNGAADAKRFLEHAVNERGRPSLGELMVTFQLHLELDRRDEFLAFRQNEVRALRILSPNGPFIEEVSSVDVYHSIGLDFPVMHFTDIEKRERGNNLTAMLTGEALLAVDNMDVNVVTDQATV